MIDIHSHLLPGVDDGAPSLQVSVDMLDAYAANGFRTVATTPHLAGRLDAGYAAAVQDAFNQVEPHARERGISLVRGFEVRLSPDLPDRLQRGEPIALGSTKAVLVDLPFTEWPLYADSTLFGVQAAGYRIVLAHPERYPSLQDDPSRATELVHRGVILQVTIGSFSGAFGKRAKRCAEALLDRGVVQIVATDAHSAGHRMAAVPAGMERLRDLVGPEQLQTLTVEAPSLLLNGNSPPPSAQLLKRSWRKRAPLLWR
jgi:protein-tyrosine phosphatase